VHTLPSKHKAPRLLGVEPLAVYMHLKTSDSWQGSPWTASAAVVHMHLLTNASYPLSVCWHILHTHLLLFINPSVLPAAQRQRGSWVG
jgi:hypothetical protein